MNPTLNINLDYISHNTKEIIRLAKESNIEIFVVTKVLNSEREVVETILNSGCKYIGDSKINNLKRLKDLDIKKVLLRLPNPSSVLDVVKYSDLSLNSSIETIRLLNSAAQSYNKIHEIILMIDLGDLREGIFYKDLDQIVPIIEEIQKLKHIHLLGLGTNLTCFGGVIPTEYNLSQLVMIKEYIEKHYDLTLDLISGGNSSSINMLLDQTIPKGINNLRIGEGIIVGNETTRGEPIPNLYQNAITLTAEVIELKIKPSYPIGIISRDAFGNVPNFIDQGLMKRAILNVGRQDVDHNNLTPINTCIKIIGSSSDHLILDVSAASDIKVGDHIDFYLNYGGILSLSTSPHIEKVYNRN